MPESGPIHQTTGTLGIGTSRSLPYTVMFIMMGFSHHEKFYYAPYVFLKKTGHNKSLALSVGDVPGTVLSRDDALFKLHKNLTGYDLLIFQFC